MIVRELAETLGYLRELAETRCKDRAKYKTLYASLDRLEKEAKSKGITQEEIEEGRARIQRERGEELRRKWWYAERCAWAIVHGEPTFLSEEAAYQNDLLFRTFVDILTVELSQTLR